MAAERWWGRWSTHQQLFAQSIASARSRCDVHHGRCTMSYFRWMHLRRWRFLMRCIHTFCIAAAIVVCIDDDVTFGECFARFVQQIWCRSFSLSQRFRIRSHIVLFRAGHVTVGTIVFDGNGFVIGVIAIVIIGLVCGIGTNQPTGVLLLFGAHFIKVFENSNYRQLNSTNRHIRTGQRNALMWMDGWKEVVVGVVGITASNVCAAPAFYANTQTQFTQTQTWRKKRREFTANISIWNSTN